MMNPVKDNPKKERIEQYKQLFNNAGQLAEKVDRLAEYLGLKDEQ